MSLAGKDHGRYTRGKFTKDALANRRELRAMRKAARLERLTVAELSGIMHNIDRCGCIADHWLVADILLRARRTYSSPKVTTGEILVMRFVARIQFSDGL